MSCCEYWDSQPGLLKGWSVPSHCSGLSAFLSATTESSSEGLWIVITVLSLKPQSSVVSDKTEKPSGNTSHHLLNDCFVSGAVVSVVKTARGSLMCLLLSESKEAEFGQIRDFGPGRT